jgi:hypothetical protein
MLFVIAFGVPLLMLTVLAVLTVRRNRIRARALAAALRAEGAHAGAIPERSARRNRADIRGSRALGYFEPPARTGEGYDGTPLAPENGE